MPENKQNSVSNPVGGFFFATNIALVVFIVDQWTKLLIVRLISEPVTVIPGFFNIVYVTNKGAAWGKFKEYPILLGILALLAIIFLIWKFKELSEGVRVREFALALLLGGIAGNLYDRLIRGAVVDFFDFYIRKFHWPAFNIADSAITIGVFLLLFSTIFSSFNSKTKTAKD